MSKGEKIISNWVNIRSRAKQDLITLMRLQDIDTLVYAGYTPTYNDGDSCSHVTIFIGTPNCILEGDYYVYISDNNEIDWVEIYPSQGPEILLEELQEKNASQLIISQVTNAKSLEELSPKYSYKEFESFLWTIADILFDTNVKSIIRLSPDNKLTVQNQDYFVY
jgi:hypothetical protein